MDWLFQGAWDWIASKTGTVIDPLLEWMYLAQWWMWGLGIIAVCMVVALFSPWDWPKKLAAWVASIAVAVVWTATVVFRRTKKVESPPKPPPQPVERPWFADWSDRNDGRF
jgi:hypothetical protein